MKRWYGGGWQNLVKHRNIAFRKAGNALELSLAYMEGLTFSALVFMLPIINFSFFGYFLFTYALVLAAFALYSTMARKRLDLLFYFPTYLFLMFLNSFILLVTFFREVVLRKKDDEWFKPERRKISCKL